MPGKDEIEAAYAEIEALEALSARAREQGIETSYYDIPAVVGRIALEERWDLRDQEAHHATYLAWIDRRCRESIGRLQAVVDGQEAALQAPAMPLAGSQFELKPQPLLSPEIDPVI